MKRILLSTVTALGVGLFAADAAAAKASTALKPGKVDLKSVGPIAFGPGGVLFISDPKAAAIYAVDTGDTKAGPGGKPLKIDKVNQKIAALLGAAPGDVLIVDLAVNPASKNAYLAVSRGRGADADAVIIRTTAAGKLESLALDKVPNARAALPDAPVDGVQGEGRRKSNPRTESITDIAFVDGKVVVAGLANEEFASTLRAIPFPFQNVAKGTTVEIYHGAHGKFETRSPVRTFTPYQVGGSPSLLAAYTCTPLVQFPLAELKPNAKIQGKTIAELGNRNRPLDMFVYEQAGKDFLLIANSARGIMKVSTDGIATAGSITSRISDTAGLKYDTIKDWQNIEQLDKLDDKLAVVVRKVDDSALTLEALPLP